MEDRDVDVFFIALLIVYGIVLVLLTAFQTAIQAEIYVLLGLAYIPSQFKILRTGHRLIKFRYWFRVPFHQNKVLQLSVKEQGICRG